MTCIVLGGKGELIRAIVCTSPWGRLHVGNRYYWVSFHPYCGPDFYEDSAMNKLYEPTGENDPIWVEFGKWFDKYQAKKQRESISPHPIVTQTETNLPISGLGGYDQVLRDEFEDGKK
jgi:hypothetical protein